MQVMRGSEERGRGVPSRAPAAAPAEFGRWTRSGASTGAPNAENAREEEDKTTKVRNQRLHRGLSPLAAVLTAAAAGDPT